MFNNTLLAYNNPKQILQNQFESWGCKEALPVRTGSNFNIDALVKCGQDAKNAQKLWDQEAESQKKQAINILAGLQGWGWRVDTGGSSVNIQHNRLNRVQYENVQNWNSINANVTIPIVAPTIASGIQKIATVENLNFEQRNPINQQKRIDSIKIGLTD